MTLRRALLLSLLVHVCLVGAGGLALRSIIGQPVATGDADYEAPPAPSLHLNLVDPPAPDTGPLDVPIPAATEQAQVAATAAASPGAERVEEARVTTAPGRLSPRQLAERLGLNVEGIDEEALRGMFSAMHSYAVQSPQPGASTYRQLLRAWIDGLMGYPYPVLEDLVANAGRRFIGGIRVEVAADGGLRLAELWIYSDVYDPDDRLAGYYERVIRAATLYRFLPPADAGLPAPHALEYRIVNPKARR